MRVIGLILAFALAGCAGRSPVPATGYITVPSAAETASAGTLTAPAGVGPYRVGPRDEVRVDVLQEPELSLVDMPIDDGGGFNMPLIGRVDAEGRTTAEVEADIAARLKRYLRQPRVAVNVTEFGSQQLTVQGAVNRPGVYETKGRATLMQAVALGQGLNEFARQREIVVFRTIDGQRHAARYDLAAIQAGQAPDPAMQSGDIIIVGYSEARRIFRDILAVLPIAAGVFIALYQR